MNSPVTLMSAGSSSERVTDHESHTSISSFQNNEQQELEDLKGKLKVMMDAVSLVSKLASVDSIDYESYYVNPTDKTDFSSSEHDIIDSTNETPRFANHCKIIVRTKLVSNDRATISKTKEGFKKENRDDIEGCDNILDIQHKLDYLQTHGDLQETSIPSLINSIHRLQSNVTHLQAEAEMNAIEIYTLQDALNKSSDRIQQLEAAVQGLYQEKTDLKSQLKLKKKESRYFAKSVREYIIMKRKEELEKDAFVATTRLSVHESMLKKSKKQGEFLDMDIDHLSMTSSFEDFDTLRKMDSIDLSTFDISLEDASFMGQSLDMTRISNGESPDSLRRYSVRPFSPTETRDRATSTDSLASTISRVTDSGVPTVRFDFQKDDLFHSDLEVKAGSTETFEYVLKEGSSSHVGLIFKLIEVTAPRQPLLDGKLLDAVTDDNTTEPTMKNSTLKGPGLSFKIDDFFSRTQNHSKKKVPPTVNCDPECVVLVSGFDNFDDLLNIRPVLGARLISIGDELLMDNKNLSLEMIHDMIMKTSICDCNPYKTVKLTFRHEPLTRDQMKKLQDNPPRAENRSIKDEPPILSNNDKPNFFDKMFSGLARDNQQRKEKCTKPNFMEKSVVLNGDSSRRESDIFEIKL